MKKLFLIFATFSLIACNNTNKSDSDVPDSDTASVQPAEDTKAMQQPAYPNPGTWKATFSPAKKGVGGKIVVTGTVNVGDPKAKVTLTKSTQQGTKNDILILHISKEPTDTKEKPVIVRYEEPVLQKNQYYSVYIMYNDKSVIVVDKIESVIK